MKTLLPLVFTFFLFLSVPSLGQETMIEDISFPLLDKLIATAKENFPRMKYYEGRANTAKINISQRKLDWFNSITFSYIYQPTNTVDIVKPNLFNGYQASVHLNLGSILQTPGEIRKSKQEYISVTGELKEYEKLLEYEVKQRYFEYIKQKKNLELYTKIVLDVESIEKEQKTRYEKNEIALKDYNETLISVSTYNTTKIETEGEVFKAKASLEMLLGKKLEDLQP